MNNLVKSSKLFLKRNASTILTCVGGAGVIVTSIMTAKATPKALFLLEQSKEEKGEELTKFEVVKTAAPAYIPAILAGASTIACIFGANVLNKCQQAALMSAYALLDNSYKDYKRKVGELYGEDANANIREDLVKDKYEETVISVHDDKTLFYDMFAERYFESTIEELQRAEYNLNRELALHNYVSLNDFYLMLGLDPLDSGAEYGWSTRACHTFYGQSWIDFCHEKVTMDDGMECCILTTITEPVLKYYEY